MHAHMFGVAGPFSSLDPLRDGWNAKIDVCTVRPFNPALMYRLSLVTPCVRLRNRGRAFGLWVSLSVCPPLFGLFARLRLVQGLV